MTSFDLNAHLNNIYAAFPEGKRKPIIGITANFWNGEATMAKAYYQQVADAGGTPVLIPPVADKDIIVSTLAGIDALLFNRWQINLSESTVAPTFVVKTLADIKQIL